MEPTSPPSYYDDGGPLHGSHGGSEEPHRGPRPDSPCSPLPRHRHHLHDRLMVPPPLQDAMGALGALGAAALVAGRLPEDQSIFHFCEGNLNFSTAHNEDDEYFHKRKLSRVAEMGRAEYRVVEDPMSHRIIEKRRRDRMNNCLADLSRLIPAEYLKKGRGRVEKTEIIEMAIKHMRYLQSRVNLGSQAGIDAVVPAPGLRVAKCEQSPCSERGEPLADAAPSAASPPPMDSDLPLRPVVRPIVTEHYRLGYQECVSEAMQFLVEVEGHLADEELCVRLGSHLEKHCEKIMKGDRLNFPRTRQPGETTSSSGSSSSCGATNGAGRSASSTKRAAEEPPMHGGQHGVPNSQLRDMLSCASPSSPSAAQQHGLHHHHHHHHHPAHRGHPLAQACHFDSCTSCRLYADSEAVDGHEGDDGHESEPHQGSPPHYSFSDASHHNYKFKNNIKQRFSEEHSNVGLVKRQRTMTRSPSPPSAASTATPSSQQTQSSVPIFVLHTKGAFYIPLTVSHEALAPYLDVDLLSDSSSGRSSAHTFTQVVPAPAGVVLHPVTISVNFQQLWKAAAPSLAPNHHHHHHHHQPPALPAPPAPSPAPAPPPTAPLPVHPLPLVPPPQGPPTPTHAPHAAHAHPWVRDSDRYMPVPSWDMAARL